jgi:hypothetical protein
MPAAKITKKCTWLDVESSSIKADTFADEGNPIFGVGISVVTQVDESWFVDRCSANSMEKCEILLQKLITFVNDQLCAVSFADSLGLLDEELWDSFNVASSIGPVFRSVSGFDQVHN